MLLQTSLLVMLRLLLNSTQTEQIFQVTPVCRRHDCLIENLAAFNKLGSYQKMRHTPYWFMNQQLLSHSCERAIRWRSAAILEGSENFGITL